MGKKISSLEGNPGIGGGMGKRGLPVQQVSN